MPAFYFSRLSIVTNEKLDYIQKADLLLGSLLIENSITFRKDDFKFVAPEVVKVGAKSYVTGYIVKYKPNYPEFVINDNKKIEQIQVENKVLAAIRFIIDIESSIVMYEESKNHIPKDTFGIRFSELVKQNSNLEVNFEAITENYDFFNRVQEVAEIKKITITLVPSNPNNSELWKDIDDDMNRDKITWYKEIQMNKKKGESIIVDEETKAKFYMSQDGYGKSDVFGFGADGKSVKLSTADETTHSKMDVSSEIKSVSDLLAKLQDKLNELIKRTKEQDEA